MFMEETIPESLNTGLERLQEQSTIRVPESYLKEMYLLSKRVKEYIEENHPDITKGII